MLFRTLVTACICVFATTASYAQVISQTSTDLAENTPIPDDGADTVGISSIINIMENEIVEDICVTINGIEHTSLGDLTAEIRYLGPNNGGTSEFVPIFDRVGGGDGLLGDNSNLFGNYTFTSNPNDSDFWSEAANTPEEVVVNAGNTYFATDSTSALSDIGEAFRGFNTAGQWELRIRDLNSLGDEVGTVDSFTLDLKTSAIPEPTSAALLCLGGLALAGRRRRA